MAQKKRKTMQGGGKVRQPDPRDNRGLKSTAAENKKTRGQRQPQRGTDALRNAAEQTRKANHTDKRE